MLLAIETSCDDTAVCILDENDGKIRDSLRVSQLVHEEFGGVVPELASRKHFSNIVPLIETLLKKNGLTYNDLKYIAVTYQPGLLGSLLIGVTVAKTLAYSLDLPLIPVHHIEGHIFSNFIENYENIPFPFLSLVISGGHTQLIYVKNFFDYKIIGDTLDDSAGEAFDKVAKILGYSYPGGPIIDKLAKNGEKDFKFPRPLLNRDNFDFSFSGLKTAVRVFKEKNPSAKDEDIAFSFQNAVTEVLYKKTKKASKSLRVKNIVLAGGVAANSQIRKVFSENFENSYIPERKHCTDNADMIARAAYFRLKNGFNVLKKEKFMYLNPKAYVKLDEEERFD